MKDKEVHNSHKRKEEVSAKGVLFSSLSSLALTAVCIVFEVLCLKYFKTGFIAKNLSWLLPLVVGLTVAYCLLAIFFAARGKSSIYRVLFSGYLLLLFFLVLLFILQKTGFLEIFQSPDRYKEYLESAGGWMPLLYIVLQYLQVVVLPIPGFVSTVAGVALFGPTKAMLCSLVGIILGSLTAFIIGRKIGYKAVAWMVGKEDLDKWLKKIKGKDYLILSIMFLLPLFPDDVLCFIAGLSSMTWGYFLVMIFVTRALSITLSAYSFDTIPFTTWWGILCWALIISAVVALFWLVCKYSDKIDWFIKNKLGFKNLKKRKKTTDKKKEDR